MNLLFAVYLMSGLVVRWAFFRFDSSTRYHTRLENMLYRAWRDGVFLVTWPWQLAGAIQMKRKGVEG